MKMKTVLFAMLILLSFVAVSCAQTERPVNITFHWTAPHDDGIGQQAYDSLGTGGGECSLYDFRWSQDSTVLASWINADTMSGEPSPGIPYQDDSFTTSLIMRNESTYWVALKVSDESGNETELSNIIRIDVGDIIYPNLIIDLRHVRN